MELNIKPAKMRVIPQDRFVFREAVQVGEVDAREAYLHLIIDATIRVDDKELKKIAQLPEVAKELGEVQAPAKKQYKPSDWRAKEVVIRDVQWQKRPIIEYLAKLYKDDVIQLIRSKFSTIPNDWQNELFQNISYRLEPQALQLSPSKDKKWKSIFVQLVFDLGSAADQIGFLGKLVEEFEKLSETGQIKEEDGKIVFETTLKGFDSVLKELDPYAGAKLSPTMIHGQPIADEPGYDKEIRSAFYDHFAEIASLIYNAPAVTYSIQDDGKIYFSVEKSPEEPESNIPEDIKRIKRISEKLDPEPALDPPSGYYGENWDVCNTCDGSGCDVCDWEGMLPPISSKEARDIKAQERLDDLYGK